MKPHILAAVAFALSLAGCGREQAESESASAPAAPAADVQASAPAPTVAAPAPQAQSAATTLAGVIAGDWRDPANVARDIWRHPKETLEFLASAPISGYSK